MNRLDFENNWPIPNEYLIELGRISAMWSSLEDTVNLVISKLAGYTAIYDYRSAIMLAHANCKQRIDILDTLLEQAVPDPNLKGYENVVKIIKRAQKARNKFIHNRIGLNPDTGKVEMASMSARGTLKTSVQAIQINEVKEVTAVIHEAMCALLTLISGNETKPMWERTA